MPCYSRESYRAVDNYVRNIFRNLQELQVWMHMQVREGCAQGLRLP